VITTVQNIDTYLAAFTAFAETAAGREIRWLHRLREDAFTRFAEVGFPTTHEEDWRFTNVSSIARTNFDLACRPADRSLADFTGWALDSAAARLVFVDGQFAPQLSSVDSLPAGVTVSSMKNTIAEGSRVLEDHLGRYLDIRRDAFCALNTAFLEDGAFVQIPRGLVLQKPIHLLFVSSEGDVPTMVHPRNLLLVEQEAQAELVEEYVSLGGGATLSNSVTELVVGQNATVSHYMIEREHSSAFNISTLRIQQDRNANVASHSVLLGGGLVRNNVHPVLSGEGAECLINGLFLGNGQQHLDNYMYVEHTSPHASSRQFYNGILDGHAHGVFHGRIVVHKNAQKTDAKQTNRNLLLSDDAQIDTKPQLEIYADDVKCTHGATIGQIEENALFYLRSRGIEEVTARGMLLAAFAHECVERMNPGPARDHIEQFLEAHLLSMAQPLPAGLAAHRDSLERSWKEVG
jgi:Fe-S cluster assembly protein SufD